MIVDDLLTAGAENAVLAKDRDDLAGVLRLGVNLAIWPRRLTARLAAYVDGLAPARMPYLRLRAAVGGLARALDAAVLPDWEDPPGRMLLVADAAALAEHYARLLRVPRVELRLERIDDDLCSKWHVDATGVRLLSTYRGRGTQWLPESATRRRHLGPGRDNRAVTSGPEAVRELPRGAVAWFKGGDDRRGVVHRSPPIAGSGEPRLLLCVESA